MSIISVHDDILIKSIPRSILCFSIIIQLTSKFKLTIMHTYKLKFISKLNTKNMKTEGFCKMLSYNQHTTLMIFTE